MQRKYLLALIGTVAVVVFLIVVAAVYETDGEEESLNRGVWEGFRYIESNDSIAITDYIGEETDVIIPSLINSKPVTIIESKAFLVTLDKQLTSVSIPSSVVTIEDQAFVYNKLASVKFAENSELITIGKYAFGSNALTNIVIPDKVKTIGDYAFFSNELEKAIVPHSVETIGSNTFSSNPDLHLMIHNVESTLNNAPWGATDITYTIAKGTQTGATWTATGGFIYTLSGNNAKITDYNGDKTTVVIPTKIRQDITDYTITSIGENAFADKGIIEVLISENVSSIGNGAFNANQLASVIIPNNVITIGDNAFSSNNLTSVTISDNAVSIGKSAFENNKLLLVNIPTKVTSIGDYAFKNNNLTSVEFEKGSLLNTIGVEAFISNDLTSINIPSKVVSIGDYAFKGRDKASTGNRLISVTFADDSVLTTIGTWAFSGNKITSIIIPKSVTEITDNVFSRNEMTSAVLQNGITSIGENAFSENRLASITLPNSVETIGEDAFSRNELMIVNIPNGLKSIGENAFGENALKEVIIPNSVETIGEDAFINNFDLNKITIERPKDSIEGDSKFWTGKNVDIIVWTG